MFTLRCTARLRKRLGMTEETTSTPPSTKLGDWYAHLLFTRPQLAEAAVATEEEAMLVAVIGKTVSRTVLGSMNDFVRMLDSYRGTGSLLEVSLHLAETPCGPLQMNRPRDETMRAFTLPA